MDTETRTLRWIGLYLVAITGTGLIIGFAGLFMQFAQRCGG